MNTFQKSFIEHFPGIVSLYLSGNAISDFEPSAFSEAKNLQQIFLKTNKIKTFPEETFADVVQKVRGQFYTEGNPIVCDCNIEWLQNIASQYNETVIPQIICDSPEKFHGKLLSEVDLMCGEETTAATATEPTPTEPTPTEADPVLIREKLCNDMKSITSRRIVFNNNQNSRNFTLEVSDTTVEISTDELSAAVAVICKECLHNPCEKQSENQKRFISDLNPDTEYLFCLFGEKEIETGDINYDECLLRKTLPVTSAQPWLLNGEKTLYFAYLTLASIVIFFIGAVATFFLIRRKPTLLRGSGRVEVVKSRDGDVVLVMPENRIIPPPTPTSAYDSISGYISLGSPYGSGKGSPPPLPPYPPGWIRRTMEEHEYLEPTRYLCGRHPRNMDLLLEYEWYTSQQYRPESRG